MSDPSAGLDAVQIGGGGAAAATVMAGLVRLLFGGALADIKSSIRELKEAVEKIDTKVNEHHAQLATLYAEMATVKAMLEKESARHDSLGERLAVMERDVAALHRRIDEVRPKGRR